MSRLSDLDIDNLLKTTKQNFLVNNIIKKGYDADTFSDFLSSKKENGSFIENWTLEELIKHVETFMRHPQIVFPRALSYFVEKKSINIKAEKCENDSIDILQIQQEESLDPVKRKLSDIQWILKAFAKEYSSISLPSSIDTKIVNNKDFIELLFFYFQILPSPSLKGFFTLPEKEFEILKSVFSIGI